MSSTKMNKAILTATLFAANCQTVSASDLVVLYMTERNRTERMKSAETIPGCSIPLPISAI